jgi:hypothetical protein
MAARVKGNCDRRYKNIRAIENYRRRISGFERLIPSIFAEWVDSHLHPLRHASGDESENPKVRLENGPKFGSGSVMQYSLIRLGSKTRSGQHHTHNERANIGIIELRGFDNRVAVLEQKR